MKGGIMMKTIMDKESFAQAVEGQKSVVMFSADWCPDCRVIEPDLPEIEKNNTSFTFYHADRDEFIDICQEYDVFGIPSFLVFHEGEEVGRFVSKDRKTKEEIQAFLDETEKKIT